MSYNKNSQSCSQIRSQLLMTFKILRTANLPVFQQLTKAIYSMSLGKLHVIARNFHIFTSDH